MITLLLLPFFLVSRVSVDVDSWYYGPEYTYRVHIDLLKSDHHSPTNRTKVFDISSTLKCRPRVPDTLNCRFATAKMTVLEEGVADLGQQVVEDPWVDEDPFEIKFNKYGIGELVVTRSMTPWTVDMIRAIVNQVNFGVDLRNKADGTFIAAEKSFIGECETEIEVTRQPWMGDPQWKDEQFEIVPMAGLGKAPGEVLRIKKKRNLERCEHKEDYYFASKNVHSGMAKSIVISVKSSVSHILISDSNFTSYTANEILVMNANVNKNVTLHEKITLKLDTVSPAKVEMPAIPNAALVSFFVRRDFENEASEEANRDDKVLWN